MTQEETDMDQAHPQLEPDETHNLEPATVDDLQKRAADAKVLAAAYGNGDAKVWASQCVRMCLAWRYLLTAFAAVLNQRDEARRGMCRLAFLKDTVADVSGQGLGEPGRYQVTTDFEAAAVWWGVPYATKLFGEPAKGWEPPTCEPLPVADQHPDQITKEVRP